MNPLEERLRFPFDDRDPYAPPHRARPARDPEIQRPERVDPSTPARIDEEIPEPYWEGQEGVGPGRRDILRREEKGEPSAETTPPPPIPEEPAP